MQDTDIEGLEPKAAAEYVLAFVTTLKKTEMDLVSATEDVTKWTGRVALAVEKGEEELAGLARAKLAEIEGKKAALENELADLRLKVVILKEKLQRLRRRFQKSVDTDVLLAELEMLVGKKDDLADRFKVEEAGAKVEELKKKMSGEGTGAKPGGTPGRPARPEGIPSAGQPRTRSSRDPPIPGYSSPGPGLPVLLRSQPRFSGRSPREPA